MSSFDIPGVLSPTLKTLTRTWWKKVSSTNSNPNKPPTTAHHGSTRPSSEPRVFGVPLTESIRYAHSSISYVDPTTNHRCYGVIPTIIAKCGAYLKEQGLMVEGVFRISGSNSRIGMLQAIFDNPEDFGANFKWKSNFTVHDAANVMRRFLNHLPEPVITLEYYRPFKDTMNEEFPTLDAKIEAFQNLINCLPLPHQYLLLYIMDMLGLFAMTTDKTFMDTSALAAVFVPGVLSHPDDELNPAGYKESQRVLEFLIENQHRLTVPRSYGFPNHPFATGSNSTIIKTMSPPLPPSTSHVGRKPSSHIAATTTDLARIMTDLQKHNFALPSSNAAVKLERSTTTIKGRKTQSPFIDATVSLSYDTSIASSNLKRSQSVPSKTPSYRRWRSIRHEQEEIAAGSQ